MGLSSVIVTESFHYEKQKQLYYKGNYKTILKFMINEWLNLSALLP